MSSKRIIAQTSRLFLPSTRTFSTSKWRFNDPTQEKHRKHQIDRPLNPHMTNTTSTITNDMPSLDKDKPPPEMISSVDVEYLPKDSVPQNTEHMTRGTQMPVSDSGPDKELEVGEIEGASFKVEPKRRFGEDMNTLRARLLYQSRKRGILESDLLLSTFADANLSTMTKGQLMQYDLFLDENDWDIYYWATQEPIPTSMKYAEIDSSRQDTTATQGQPPKLEKDRWLQGKPRSGEWAQTVGAFKPAYRPVPQRWKNSDILAMLRKHVKDRSTGTEAQLPIEGSSLNQHVKRINARGLAFMPPVRNFDTR